MDDFAAAAMFRLIRLGLQQQGLAVPDTPTPAQARVPLQQKRALADALLQAHGPLALLRIGQAIEGAPEEPVMIALAQARDPFDLLDRWQRLERFAHSRHRSEVLAQGSQEMTLRHYAVAPHPPPRPGEDLLVFGLLFALLRHCGTQGLRARPQGSRRWFLRNDQWQEVSLSGDTGCWEIAWTEVRPATSELETPGATANWPALARRVIEGDPGRSWQVAGLAADLHLSSRSLQRRLREEGCRFSDLLVTARLNAASRLLLEGEASLAEIGYGCGFADQAHFSRAFKRHIGTTPSQFRSDFEAAG